MRATSIEPRVTWLTVNCTLSPATTVAKLLPGRLNLERNALDDRADDVQTNAAVFPTPAVPVGYAQP